MNDRKIGTLGEEIAAEFLKSIGYDIVERNFTVKGGEIDIIAADGATLVFVEVKTRNGNEYLPALSVDRRKCKNIVGCAEKFVLKKSEIALAMKARFDYVEIIFNAENKSENPKIRHYKNIIT